MTGTIIRLISDKGFGFIRAGNGSEYFFHHSSVKGDFNSLKEKQEVTFEATQGPKGPRAEQVALVSKRESAIQETM